MNRLLTYILLSAVAVACGKTTEPDTHPGDGVIRANARIAESTEVDVKAAPALPGSALAGVQFIQTNKNGSTVVDRSSAAGRIAADGKVTFITPLTYHMKNYTATLMGYYPSASVSGDMNKYLAWDLDGTKDIMITADVSVGKYTAPVEASLSLVHKLARIEVVCYAEDNSSAPAVWGDITNIEVLEAPSDFTANIDAGIETFYSSQALAMLQSDYTTPFARMAVPSSTNTDVNAAAMIYGTPTLSDSKFRLGVRTTKQYVVVNVNPTTFNAGYIYKVSLKFKQDATIYVSGVTITDWVDGYTSDPDVEL